MKAPLVFFGLSALFSVLVGGCTGVPTKGRSSA